MIPFSPQELDDMQETQTGAMMDLCAILKYGESYDAMHYAAPSWTAGPAVNCGIEQRGGRRQRAGIQNASDASVVIWDARVRLPIDTVIDLRDRVRLMSRYGEPVSYVDYEIIAPPSRGPSGLVLELRKVSPGVA